MKIEKLKLTPKYESHNSMCGSCGEVQSKCACESNTDDTKFSDEEKVFDEDEPKFKETKNFKYKRPSAYRFGDDFEDEEDDLEDDEIHMIDTVEDEECKCPMCSSNEGILRFDQFIVTECNCGKKKKKKGLKSFDEMTE